MGGTGLAIQHEYILWGSNHGGQFKARNENVRVILLKAEECIKEHNGINHSSRKAFADWVRGNKSLSGGERCYQFIEDDGRVYQSVGLG